MSSRHATLIQPVEPAAAYELVVAQIRRAIHIGKYIPGDKLPAERLLAQQLGVSRTTVREAIRVLEGEGYIESRRGAGGGIVILHQGQTEERMKPIVKERLPEFEELLDFRVTIEGAAAALAAQRRTKQDLATLTRAFEIMEQDEGSARFRAADSAFHLGIADAARNRFMRKAIEDARAAMWMPIDSVITRVLPSAHAHHRQILDAIRANNPRAAERAVAAHIETVRRDLRRVASSD